MTFKNKTIGILGGGQLGKMTAIAAKRLGYNTKLYCPKGDNPAEYSVNEYIDGNWDDINKLEIFGSNVDVITSEFENIPAKTLDNLSSRWSGTGTTPTLGSIVQKGKFAAWALLEFVSALNKVDLPTLGKPTIPHLKLITFYLLYLKINLIFY